MIWSPDFSMNTRSWFDCTLACVSALSCRSLSSRNDEYSRSVSCVGPNAMNSAATTGSRATNRRSRIRKRRPMPAQAPIQALRVSVVTSATISAGITSDAQMRSFLRNRIRAVAVHATSIS